LSIIPAQSSSSTTTTTTTMMNNDLTTAIDEGSITIHLEKEEEEEEEEQQQGENDQTKKKTWLKLSELEKGKIYVIDYVFTYTTRKYGKHVAVSLQDAFLVQLPDYMGKPMMSDLAILRKFKVENLFLKYDGTRISRTGSLYNKVIFPKVRSIDHLCLCHDFCGKCLCVRLIHRKTELPPADYTCPCTIKDAINFDYIKCKISSIIEDPQNLTDFLRNRFVRKRNRAFLKLVDSLSDDEDDDDMPRALKM